MATQTKTRTATSRHLKGKGSPRALMASTLLIIAALLGFAPAKALAVDVNVQALSETVSEADKSHIYDVIVSRYNESTGSVSDSQHIGVNGGTYSASPRQLIHLAVEAEEGYGANWSVAVTGEDGVGIETSTRNVYDPTTNTQVRHTWFRMPESPVTVSVSEVTATVTYKVWHTVSGVETEKVIHTHRVVLGRTAPDIMATLSTNGGQTQNGVPIEKLTLPRAWLTGSGATYSFAAPVTKPIELYAAWPTGFTKDVRAKDPNDPNGPTVFTREYARLEFAINYDSITPIEVRLVRKNSLSKTFAMHVIPGLTSIYRKDDDELDEVALNPRWLENLETGTIEYIAPNDSTRVMNSDAVVYLDYNYEEMESQVRRVRRWIPVRFVSATDVDGVTVERLIHTELVHFNLMDSSSYYNVGNPARRISLPADISRANMVFNGWGVYRSGTSYDSDTNYGAAYNFNQPVNELLTLKAKWRPVTHVVTYWSGNNVVVTDVVEHGATTRPPTTTNGNNQILDRWTIDPEGNKTFDFATPVTSDCNLYAQWVEGVQTDDVYHVVTYIAKYGSNTKTLDKRLVKHGSLATMVEATFYDKDGKGIKVKSWTTDEAGQNVFDFSKTPITEDKILYAKWGATIPDDVTDVYTVTFMVNNAKYAFQEVAAGGHVTPPEDPRQTDKEFAGWYRDLAQESTKLNTSAEVNTDLVFHAKFDDASPKEHAVTYWYVSPEDGSISKAQGVTLPDGTAAPTTVSHGDYLTVPDSITKRTPVSTDDSLKWFVDEACSVAYISAPVERDMALYATYVNAASETGDGSTYNVYYYVGTQLIGTYPVEEEGGLPRIDEPENPTSPEGFVGWFIGGEDGVLWRDAAYEWGPGIGGVYGDTYVYAVWKAPTTHTVWFNNVSVDGSEPYALTVEDGAEITPEQTIQAANELGLNTEGTSGEFSWYADRACTVKYDRSKPVTRDFSLFAGATQPNPDTPFKVHFLTRQGSTEIEVRTVEMSAGDRKPEAPSVTELTVEGKRFLGWFVGNVDGPNNNGVAWDDVESVSAETYVYAHWAEEIPAKEQYTVIFKSQGKTVTVSIIDAGESVTAPSVTLPNATFEGWYSDASFQGTREGGSEMTVTPSGSITYYAKFINGDGQPIVETKYRIAFFVNGKLVKTLMLDQNAPLYATTSGTAGTTLLSDGYRNFDGWYEDKGLTTPQPPHDNAELPAVTQDTDYYAQADGIEPPSKYHTVTFMSGNNVVRQVRVIEGATVTAPQAVDEKDRVVERWTTDIEGANPFDFATPVTSDLTLYAQWREAESDGDEYHFVTFVARHGEQEEVELAHREVKHGTKTTSLEASYYDENRQITAVAWTTDEAGENVFDFENTLIEQDYKLYAKWSHDDDLIREDDTEHYPVRFIVDGSLFAVQDVVKDGFVRVPETPSQTGKTFTGWYLDLNVAESILDISDRKVGERTGQQVVDGPLTYYAKFEDVAATSHKVSYKYVDEDGLVSDAYGVKLANGAAAPSEVEHNGVLERPTVVGNRSANGDELVWFVNESCAAAYQFGQPVTGNLVLYGQYKGSGQQDEVTYKVHYVVGSRVVATYTVKKGEKPTEAPVNPTLPADIVSGSFAGWYVGSETGPLWCDAEGHFSDGISGVYADTYVYAGWNVDTTYKVTFMNADDLARTWELVVVDKDDDADDGVITAKDTRDAAVGVGLDDLATAAGDGRVSWYADEACKVTYDTSKPLTGALRLYAKSAATDIDGDPRVVRFISLGKLVREVTMPMGATVPVPQPPTAAEITREGYRLTGWRVGTSSGDDPNGVPYENVSGIYADAYVYAQWATAQPQKEQVTVTFMSLGSVVKAATVDKGEGVTAPEVTLSSEAMVFEGWYDNIDFTGSVALADRGTCNPTKDITYYAKYTRGDVSEVPVREIFYTVGFVVNKELVASTQVRDREVPRATRDGKAGGTPLRDSYDGFNGWYRDQSLSDPDGGLRDDGFDAVAGANVSYYASAEGVVPDKWYHKVTYVSQGEVVAIERVLHGTVATAPATVDTDNMTLDRWTTDEPGKNAYDFSAAVTGDLMLYAQWVSGDDDSHDGQIYHLVTFVALHGVNETVLEQREVKHGDYTTAPNVSYSAKDKEIKPEKWTRDSAGTDAFDFDATPITEDIKLFAKWSEDDGNIRGKTTPHFVVTFIANGSIFAIQDVENEGVVKVPKTPAAAGKTFYGWFTDEKGTNGKLGIDDLNEGDNTKYEVKEDVTFYAKFIDAQTSSGTQHKVTYLYVDDSGKVTAAKRVRVGNADAVTTVADGQTIARPTSITNRDKATDEDLVWFVDDRCSSAYEFATPVKSDITLYAKYVKNPGGTDTNKPSFKVTYLVGNKVVYTHTVRQGEMPGQGDKPANPALPTSIASGTFAGWRLGGEQGPMWLDASGKFDSGITGVYNDVYAYATWNVDPAFDVYFVNVIDETKTKLTIVNKESDESDGLITVAQTREAARAVGLTLGPDDAEFTWYVDRACTVTFDRMTPVVNDMTLYAGVSPVATPDATHTVYFISLGRVVKRVELAAGVTTKPEAPTAAEISREGYKLDGWRVGSKDGDSESGANWSNVGEVISDTWVYAQWSLAPSGDTPYIVTFINQSETVLVVKINKGESMTAPNISLPTKNATFAGWYDNVDLEDRAGSAPLREGQTFTPKGNETYYAKFVDSSDGDVVIEDTGYPIAFFVNNELKAMFQFGLGEKPHPTTNGIASGTPIRKEYDADKFDGWHANKQLSDEALPDSELPPVSGRASYYASATNSAPEAERHRVTFISGGKVVYRETVEHEDRASEPKAVDDEAKLADRWTTDEAGTNTYDFSTPVVSDLTLYAQWNEPTGGSGEGEQPTYHVVEFVAKHGSDNTLLERREVKHGSTTSKLAARYYDDEKQIVVTEWTTDPEGTNIFDFENTTILEDKTLYAKWSDDDDDIRENPNATPHYRVAFMVEDGLFAVQDVVDGGFVMVPETPGITGKAFGGWFSEKNGAGDELGIPSGSAVGAATTEEVHGDLVYHAFFTDSTVGMTHTVSYMYVDEEGAIGVAKGVMVEDDKPAPTVVPDGGQIQKPTKIANRAAGTDTLVWFIDELCEVSYQFEAPVHDNITIYAKYVDVKEATDPTADDNRPLFKVRYFVEGLLYATQSVRQGELPSASSPTNPALPARIRSGVFAGWMIGSESGALWRDASHTYSNAVAGVYANTDVYAAWIEDPSYKVTFVNVNTEARHDIEVINREASTTDGRLTVADTRAAANVVDLDETLVPENESLPVTWYVDRACSSTFDLATEVTSNFTLYAGANGTNPEVAHTIHFISLGKEVASIELAAGVKTAPAAPEVSREGYRLATWRVGTSTGELADGAPWESVDEVVGDMWVYAEWASSVPTSKQFTVTFISLGEVVMAAVVDDGDSVVAPAVSLPDVEGATFVGWYDNPDFVGDEPIANRATIKPEHDAYYYAKFTDGQGATVTGNYHAVAFFVNDQLKHTVQVLEGTKPYGTTNGKVDGVSLRSGYDENSFNGWFANRTLTDPSEPYGDNDLPAAAAPTNYYANARSKNMGDDLVITVVKNRESEAPDKLWQKFSVGVSSANFVASKESLFDGEDNILDVEDSFTTKEGDTITLTANVMSGGYEIEKWIVTSSSLSASSDEIGTSGVLLSPSGANNTVSFVADASHNRVLAVVRPISYTITQDGDFNKWYKGDSPKLYDADDPSYRYTYTVESEGISLPEETDFDELAGWGFVKWTASIEAGGRLVYFGGLSPIGGYSEISPSNADRVAGDDPADVLGVRSIMKGSYGNIVLTPRWMTNPYYLLLNDPDTATNTATLLAEHYPTRIAIRYGESVTAENGSDDTELYTRTIRNVNDVDSPLVALEEGRSLPEREFIITLMNEDGRTKFTEDRTVKYAFDGYWDALDPQNGLKAASTGATQYIGDDGRPTNALTNRALPTAAGGLSVAWKDLAEDEAAKLELPLEYPVASAGKVFKSWTVAWANKDGSPSDERPLNYNATYAAGATLPEPHAIDTDHNHIVLTPSYEDVEYTITYRPYKQQDNIPEDVTVTLPAGKANTVYTATMTDKLTLAKPSISDKGYTFLGWEQTTVDDEDAIEEEYDAAGYVVAIEPGSATNVTYTARWSPNRYQVTLKPGDRTNADEDNVADPTNVYVQHNNTTRVFKAATGTDEATIAEPKRNYVVTYMSDTTGHDVFKGPEPHDVAFIGYVTPDGTRLITFDEDGTPVYNNGLFSISDPVVLKGLWSETDGTLTMPSAPSNASGFIGWYRYADENGTETVLSDPIPAGGQYTLQGNEQEIRFRPLWRGDGESVITYTSDPEGASYEEGHNPNRLTYTQAETPLELTLTEPKLTGYSFVGWTLTRTNEDPKFSLADFAAVEGMTKDEDNSTVDSIKFNKEGSAKTVKLTIPADSSVEVRDLTLTARFEVVFPGDYYNLAIHMDDDAISRDPSNSSIRRTPRASMPQDVYTRIATTGSGEYVKTGGYSAESADFTVVSPTEPRGYHFAGWRIDGVTSINRIEGGALITIVDEGDEPKKVTYRLISPEVELNASADYVPYEGSGGNSFLVKPEATLMLLRGSYGNAELTATWHAVDYTLGLWLNGATSPTPDAEGIDLGELITADGTIRMPRATMKATYDSPYIPGPAVNDLARVTNVHYHGNTGDATLDQYWYDSDVVLNHTFAGWDLNFDGPRADLTASYDASVVEVDVSLANAIFESSLSSPYANGPSLFARWDLATLQSQGLYRPRNTINARSDGYVFVGWVLGEGDTEVSRAQNAYDKIYGNDPERPGNYIANDLSRPGINEIYKAALEDDSLASPYESEALQAWLVQPDEDFDGVPEVHLYAAWVANYTISYRDVDDNELGQGDWPTVLGNNPYPTEYAYMGGRDFIVLNPEYSPQRAGYTFTGWTLDAPNGPALEYNSDPDAGDVGYLLPKTVGNKVLYAHFALRTDYIDFDVELPNMEGAVTFLVSGIPLASDSDGVPEDRVPLTVTQTVHATEKVTTDGAISYRGSARLRLPVNDVVDTAGYTVRVVEAIPWFDVTKGTITSDPDSMVDDDELVVTGLNVQAVEGENGHHYVSYVANDDAYGSTSKHRSALVVNKISSQ